MKKSEIFDKKYPAPVCIFKTLIILQNNTKKEILQYVRF